MGWRLLVICGSLWVLMACVAPSPPPTATAMATATAQLSEGLARALALAAVSQSGPEMLPAMAPATSVWLVKLSGSWEGGRDAPEITTTLARYRTARVVLDATTGQAIVTSYAP